MNSHNLCMWHSTILIRCQCKKFNRFNNEDFRSLYHFPYYIIPFKINQLLYKFYFLIYSMPKYNKDYRFLSTISSNILFKHSKQLSGLSSSGSALDEKLSSLICLLQLLQYSSHFHHRPICLMFIFKYYSLLILNYISITFTIFYS